MMKEGDTLKLSKLLVPQSSVISVTAIDDSPLVCGFLHKLLQKRDFKA